MRLNDSAREGKCHVTLPVLGPVALRHKRAVYVDRRNHRTMACPMLPPAKDSWVARSDHNRAASVRPAPSVRVGCYSTVPRYNTSDAGLDYYLRQQAPRQIHTGRGRSAG